jgi:hypothetical protein
MGGAGTCLLDRTKEKGGPRPTLTRRIDLTLETLLRGLGFNAVEGYG